MTAPLKTVAQLRAEVQHHRTRYPSNAIGTAADAVTVLEALIAAEPSEVFRLLDELRQPIAPERTD